jgi:hypothetical protein
MNRREMILTTLGFATGAIPFKSAIVNPWDGIYRTVHAGYWSNPDIWSHRRVPTGCGDQIIVQNPVLLDSHVVNCTIWLDLDGMLKLSARDSLTSQCLVQPAPSWRGKVMLSSNICTDKSIVVNNYFRPMRDGIYLDLPGHPRYIVSNNCFCPTPQFNPATKKWS